jgi:hypothetical protein
MIRMTTVTRKRSLLSKEEIRQKLGQEEEVAKHYVTDQELSCKEWTTPTKTGNTASTASSKTTPRRIASRGFTKRNHAETNKDMPIGLKCTWPATMIKMKEINRDSSRVSLMSLMTPLIQAPSIISQ